MICPKCGEVNSTNFLFCGMCGTILEPARRATAPVASATPVPASPPPPAASAATISAPPSPPASSPITPPRQTASQSAAVIGGPSMLGLNQPNVEVLRERAFSGLESYGEPEESRSGGRRVFLMLVLLALLGAAGWWTYTNYMGVAETGKAASPGSSAGSETKSTADASTAPQGAKNAAPVEPAAAESPAAKPDAAPETKPPVVTPAPAESKAAESEPQPAPKPATPVPTAARHEVSATRIPAAADTGDALFRRGEAYLYGRNGTEDCGNALKYLKMASDKQHAKARSTMGTMYATGHCVSRDLPSSYRWFALALRADPNNSILEKDLSAVWNQMTPPERQLATKSQ